MKIVLETLLLL